MMKYLLDTNICISSITYAELQYGVGKSSNPSRNEQALIQYVTPLEILDFDFRAAAEYENLRSILEKESLPIGPLDTLIAAHYLSLDLVLVTNNVREFQRIPRLKIENWVN